MSDANKKNVLNMSDQPQKNTVTIKNCESIKNAKDFIEYKKKLNDLHAKNKGGCGGSADSPAVSDTANGSGVSLTDEDKVFMAILVQAYLFAMIVTILEGQTIVLDVSNQLRVDKSMSDDFKGKLHKALGRSRKVIWSIVRDLKSIDKKESNEATAEWSYLFETEGAAKDKRNDYRLVVQRLLHEGIYLQKKMEVIFALTAVKKGPAQSYLTHVA